MFSLTDSLLVEEIEGLALVAGQLLQGAALLLHRGLDLIGGRVVLDVHRRLHRRLLGCAAGRAEQTAETGGVRAGKWEGQGEGGKAQKTERIEGVDTSGSSSGTGRVQHVRVTRYPPRPRTIAPC